MNAEVWAIVGVVVGAVLGGGAQVLADWLSRKEDRRNKKRELQHAAYSQLLGLSVEAIRVGNQVEHDMDEDGNVPPDVGAEVLLLVQRLQAADAEIRLVAPSDTMEKAHDLYLACMGCVGVDKNRPRIGGRISPFVALTKRDLGLD